MARFKIKEIAEKQNFNASKLARKADLAHATVYALWENGDANPSIETLKKIAVALKVSVVDLLGEELGGQLKAPLASTSR